MSARQAARQIRWFLASLLASTAALAQGPEPGPPSLPSVSVVDDEEPEVPPVPPARDTLGGHFVAGLRGGLTLPFGSLAQSASATHLGVGPGVALDLGFGVSRTVVVGLWGEFASYSASGACRQWQAAGASSSTCGATSLAVGPFVRYHLVQGVRFDPWLLVGPGYRMLTLDTPIGKQPFSGVDWFHVAVGGDYYPWSGVGLGPWIGLDAGVFTGRRTPPGSATRVRAAWHEGFTAGLRVVLDIPGK